MTEMDNVSIKVIEDARNIRAENLKEAEEKASGILAGAAKKVKEIKAETRAGVKERYGRTLDMEMFRARSALDQKVLIAKLEIVDGIIGKARARLSGLDKRGWERFLKKMAAELDISRGIYSIGRKEKVLDDSIATVIKNIEPDKGKADFDRGLRITGGKAEILLSPENYLDMDQEDLKMEIASYLFSGEK